MAGVEIHDAREGELDALSSVLRSAGLGTSVRQLLEFPHASAHGRVLVAAHRGRVIGGAATASFGATGWIGALGVVAAARHRGIGTALTEAAVGALRAAGARTVLLYATEAGRPVYEEVGFVDEGDAHAWRDGLPPRRGRPQDGVRPLRRTDREALLALDAAATGEDRRAVLDALDLDHPRSGLALERDGRLLASALRSPWGLGPSVVAAEPEAGVALLSAVRRDGGPLVVSLPDGNAAAVRALRAWGLQPINRAVRMRLGPEVAHRPERMFGLFNLFWG